MASASIANSVGTKSCCRWSGMGVNTRQRGYPRWRIARVCKYENESEWRLHLRINGNAPARHPVRNEKNLLIEGADHAAALVTSQNGPASIAESFRSTLASILRNEAGRKQKTILITSAGPAERGRPSSRVWRAQS